MIFGTSLKDQLGMYCTISDKKTLRMYRQFKVNEKKDRRSFSRKFMAGMTLSFHPSHARRRGLQLADDVVSYEFERKCIKYYYDPLNNLFKEISIPTDFEIDNIDSDEFENWCFEQAVQIWKEDLEKRLSILFSELRKASIVAKDRRKESLVWSHYTELAHSITSGEDERYVHDLYMLVREVNKTVSELKAMIKTKHQSMVRVLPSQLHKRMSFARNRAPHASCRSARVAAATSPGDDSGGDSGGSDGPSSDPDASKPLNWRRPLPFARLPGLNSPCPYSLKRKRNLIHVWPVSTRSLCVAFWRRCAA